MKDRVLVATYVALVYGRALAKVTADHLDQ